MTTALISIKEKIKSLNGNQSYLNKNNDNHKKAFVFLLIDNSGSMSGNGIKQAISGSKSFFKNAIEKSYLVGLIQFNTEAEVLLAPTNDTNHFFETIEKVESEGGTNMTDALKIATRHLLNKISLFKKYICLVTDGMPNNEESAIAAADKAKNSGIEIIAIGTEDADEEFLKKIRTVNGIQAIYKINELSSAISNIAGFLPDNSR